jgi:hypothetical protein
MNWPLRKQNVRLRVTRFAPDQAQLPIAGLPDDEREAHRATRAAECAKVERIVTYPAWRLEELREKYAALDAYEPNEVCDE